MWPSEFWEIFVLILDLPQKYVEVLADLLGLTKIWLLKQIWVWVAKQHLDNLNSRSALDWLIVMGFFKNRMNRLNIFIPYFYLKCLFFIAHIS